MTMAGRNLEQYRAAQELRRGSRTQPIASAKRRKRAATKREWKRDHGA